MDKVEPRPASKVPLGTTETHLPASIGHAEIIARAATYGGVLYRRDPQERKS